MKETEGTRDEVGHWFWDIQRLPSFEVSRELRLRVINKGKWNNLFSVSRQESDSKDGRERSH